MFSVSLSFITFVADKAFFLHTGKSILSRGLSVRTVERMTKSIDLGNCKPWLGAYFSFSCEILSFRVFQADQLSAALPRFTTATSRLCWRLEGLAGVAPYCAGAAPYEVQRS